MPYQVQHLSTSTVEGVEHRDIRNFILVLVTIR